MRVGRTSPREKSRRNHFCRAACPGHHLKYGGVDDDDDDGDDDGGHDGDDDGVDDGDDGRRC